MIDSANQAVVLSGGGEIRGSQSSEQLCAMMGDPTETDSCGAASPWTEHNAFLVRPLRVLWLR